MFEPSPPNEEGIGRKASRRRVRCWARGVASIVALFVLPWLGDYRAHATTAIVTGTEWVFVRRGPGNQFPPFARVPSGSTVEVQEIEGDWARIITASGQVGFIHKKFLSFPTGNEPAGYPQTPAVFREGPGSGSLPTRTPAPRTVVLRSPTAVPSPTQPPPPSPSRTRSPTRTLKPTRTATPSRTPPATRTPSATRSPTKTASPLAGTTTRVLSAPALPGVDTTPTGSPTGQTPLGHPDRSEGSTVPAWEAELLALKQELVSCRQQNSQTPTLTSCPEEIQRELVRLRELLEANPRTRSLHLPPNPEPVEPATYDRHAISPIAVFLGTVGLIVGWWGGSRYARRQERARRSRLRF